MMRNLLIFSLLLSLLVSKALGQVIPDEAKRYFDRGVAAVELAKSPADYVSAIKEFRQAATLAPNWPDVYYNLGMVQEKAGKYNDAITSLKQYLRLAPNASDAATVKSLINKLEFKAEQEITKEVALDIYGSLSDKTKWRFVGEGSAYKNYVQGLSRDGDRIGITFMYDLGKGTILTVFEEPHSKTLTLTYIFTVWNWCVEPHCGVFGEYIFKIVSKNKVQVEAREVWPEIRPYVEEKTKHLTFEYIRI